MGKGATGVNTGTIIHTRTKKTKQWINKKDSKKRKRAKICVDCKDNKEGFCNKYNSWCHGVNYICAGTENPYECKVSNKHNNSKTKKNDKKKKLNKNKDAELGQVVKPKFDTKNMVRFDKK
ncbi:hypothetical protein [Clostridioides sp. ZZV14-6044]|uniref:hypothetical protein n=1 Tax=unclassified Clostridioides TaxID=2635829 RepID=UPI001D11AC64|nr:hypothetical protein [Clostridioides sp. ZZV14-6045]MCC0740861.1 hypothetical protein [Clostridioides sp. ZZV14-5902]MCC0744975.1 hypothetical protein [Clostridioides sp. ZZV14-6044]MCC0753084.1 hypothetical protein [Clostridioides sp. ZZV13-5731]